jgi:hypothetical protein
MDMLILVLPAIAAFLIGCKLGRRASVIGLAICGLLFIGLSVYARHKVAESGLFGWQYYGPGKAWPLTTGLCLFSSCLALIGPASFRRWRYAVCLSAPLVVLFVATVIPVKAVACIGFAACV